MTRDQAIALVVQLAANWSPPKWSPEKFDLFVQKLEPLPYKATAQQIEHLINTRTRFECPVVADVTKPVESRMRAIRDMRSSRLLLAGPRDPEVQQMLRDCVARLEAKGGAVPERKPEAPETATLPLSAAELAERARRKKALREQAERIS